MTHTGIDLERDAKLRVIASAIQSVLKIMGVELHDPNIVDTPERYAKAMVDAWLSGYGRNPADVIKVFPNTEQLDDMVVVKDIQFYSTCAHHLAPFFGKAAIAYVPDKLLLGLSKNERVLDIISRRLQLQEGITRETADVLMQTIAPKGVMVVLYDVQHLCMSSRGAEAHEAVTTTSAVRGIFKDVPSARAEALSLIFNKG